MRNSNMQKCNMPSCMMPEPRMPEPRMPESRMQEPRMSEPRMPENKNTGRCEDFPIGMAYVPWQSFRDIYEPDRALDAGTIFAELDKPFLGRRALRR